MARNSYESEGGTEGIPSEGSRTNLKLALGPFSRFHAEKGQITLEDHTPLVW